MDNLIKYYIFNNVAKWNKLDILELRKTQGLDYFKFKVPNDMLKYT